MKPPDFHDRPPARATDIVPERPHWCIGFLFRNRYSQQETIRIRRYKPFGNTVPPKFPLPATILAMTSINACRAVRITEYAGGDDKYDHFNFEDIEGARDPMAGFLRPPFAVEKPRDLI